MTPTEQRARILGMIAAAKKEIKTVSETDELIGDLGFSSIEITVLLADLEDAFSIRIPSSALRHIRCAGDLCDTVLARTKQKSNGKEASRT